MTYADDEPVTLYQGYLLVREHLRPPVPRPTSRVAGAVALSVALPGTQLVASGMDAEHTATYTRRGLGVSFRRLRRREVIALGDRILMTRI